MVQLWYSFGSALVQLWFSLLWPNISIYLPIDLPICLFGVRLDLLANTESVYLAFGLLCSPTPNRHIIYLSIYLFIWRPACSARQHRIDIYIYMYIYLSSHLFIWRLACSARQHQIHRYVIYLSTCLFGVRLALLANTE